MTAYYNEIDPFAAAWLRNLIDAKQIAPGIVDERDIRDIRPSDLDGFDQFHAFAGIGGWSHALRLAGVSDSARLWTGSCPCQPFSAAGKSLGFADERHLWPAFFHLIDRFRPERVYGEQVASKDGLAWLDLVYDDLEGAGYACWAADLCAASVGAPHIRQRLWFVAHAMQSGRSEWRPKPGNGQAPWSSGSNCVCDASASRLERRDAGALGDERATVERAGALGGLGNATSERQREARAAGTDTRSAEVPTGAGHWDRLEWLPCRDRKTRPTQSRFQSLADGVWPSMVDSGAGYLEPLARAQVNRASMLKGAGNAIVPQVAAEFIRAYVESA